MSTTGRNSAAIGLALILICEVSACNADAQTTRRAGGKPAPNRARIIFLHHSTGERIWNGGVAKWFAAYNAASKTDYRITQQNFPKDSPYGWENYPYDYWNIWVRHAGAKPYKGEPTLEILTRKYDVIVFKHCFPVCAIEADTGRANVASNEKRIENYKLQYEALKKKMRSYPKVRFIVWTGAVQVKAEMDEAAARRAKAFFAWVRTRWDEKGDNIFVWDFYSLETAGGLYLKAQHAQAAEDSHPNETFSRKVAPYFCQRVVDVIRGQGDKARLTGEGGKPLPKVAVGPRPAPRTRPAVPSTRPTSAPAVEIAPVGPGKWLFDNAEKKQLEKQLWGAGAAYATDGKDRVVKITFAGGEQQDWGEYGKQRIVRSRAPAKNHDVARYRYLALRVKTDRKMEIVLSLVTRANPRAAPHEPHFAFTGYLHPKAGAWAWFVLDLTKLELAVEGPEAYAKAGKPTRPMKLTCLKLCTNVKNEKAAVALDDITFLRDLPAALKPHLLAP